MKVYAVWCDQCEAPMLGATVDEYVARHWVLSHEEEKKHECRVEEMKLTYES